MYIKRAYNDKINKMKKNKIELLKLISKTKKDVHDLNVKLRIEDEDEIFK